MTCFAVSLYGVCRCLCEAGFFSPRFLFIPVYVFTNHGLVWSVG